MLKQRVTTLILMWLLIIFTAPLHAGQTSDDPVENFSNGVSISAFLVISIPIYILVSRPLEAVSEKKSRGIGRYKAKDMVPDMEVKDNE